MDIPSSGGSLTPSEMLPDTSCAPRDELAAKLGRLQQRLSDIEQRVDCRNTRKANAAKRHRSLNIQQTRTTPRTGGTTARRRHRSLMPFSASSRCIPSTSVRTAVAPWVQHPPPFISCRELPQGIRTLPTCLNETTFSSAPNSPRDQLRPSWAPNSPRGTPLSSRRDLPQGISSVPIPFRTPWPSSPTSRVELPQGIMSMPSVDVSFGARGQGNSMRVGQPPPISSPMLTSRQFSLPSTGQPPPISSPRLASRQLSLPPTPSPKMFSRQLSSPRLLPDVSLNAGCVSPRSSQLDGHRSAQQIVWPSGVTNRIYKFLA